MAFLRVVPEYIRQKNVMPCPAESHPELTPQKSQVQTTRNMCFISLCQRIKAVKANKAQRYLDQYKTEVNRGLEPSEPRGNTEQGTRALAAEQKRRSREGRKRGCRGGGCCGRKAKPASSVLETAVRLANKTVTVLMCRLRPALCPWSCGIRHKR